MEECDLVMKGGITSGVVYPYAIAEIAGRYRLRSIGGTSAGAIAAVMAAAAEYRRQESAGQQSKDGFDEIIKRGNALATDLESLFQPAPALKVLYKLMMAAVAAKGNKVVAMLFASIGVFWWQYLVGLVPVLAGGYAACTGPGYWPLAAGILAGIIWIATSIAIRLYRLANGAFVDNNFGLCPGSSQPGYKKVALTNWMADIANEIAGRPAGSNPLLVGELTKHQIEIAAMTTDLSSGRPYQLPFKTGIHFFSKREFARLFPDWILDYMVGDQQPLQVSAAGVPTDLYKLPVDGDMPVVVVARMSLSFPGLLQAVPLYRHDNELQTPSAGHQPDKSWKIRKCLFSDGGISSNFPIHIFDGFLPSRPTLGISLAEYSEQHHGKEFVKLPRKARTSSTALVVRPIKDVLGFMGSIVNTAKDWQDTLQSKLQGSAERIVEIRLTQKQGGMNLKMEPQVIRQLGKLGEEAGQLLVGRFDFDEHRWRRALTFATVMERELDRLHENYHASPPGGTSYADILTNYSPKSFVGRQAWRIAAFKPFIETLVALGETEAAAQQRAVKDHIKDGRLPVVDARIRLIASPNRVPRANKP